MDSAIKSLTHPSSSLLSPLGQYRKSFITPSRGKRDKSRKRKSRDDSVSHPDVPPAVPPTPELATSLDAGLAKVSRSLEKLSSTATSSHSTRDEDQEDKKTSASLGPGPYAVVFVARSGQSSAFHSHFPQMVATASSSLPEGQSIRLVGFSRACEDRLSSCLGIPRVSCIGLREGSQLAKGIIEFVRDHVPPVDVPWLREARDGQFLKPKINACETTVGVKRPKTS